MRHLNSAPYVIILSMVILIDIGLDRCSGKLGGDSDAKFKREGLKQESKIAEVVP